MTCPESGTWFKRGQSLNISHNFLTRDGKDKGLYHCEYNKNNKKKYYFYVEGKGEYTQSMCLYVIFVIVEVSLAVRPPSVCANCFELDATLFGTLIVADVSITVILMIFIYKCTKKKSSPGTKGKKQCDRVTVFCGYKYSCPLMSEICYGFYWKQSKGEDTGTAQCIEQCGMKCLTFRLNYFKSQL